MKLKTGGDPSGSLPLEATKAGRGEVPAFPG